MSQMPPKATKPALMLLMLACFLGIGSFLFILPSTAFRVEAQPLNGNASMLKTSKRAVNANLSPNPDNLSYHNGLLLNNPKSVLIFFGSGWTTSNLKTDHDAIKGYFDSLNNSNWTSILTQYNINNTHYLFLDEIKPSPSTKTLSCYGFTEQGVVDSDVRAAIESAIANDYGPSSNQFYDGSGTVFAFFPPGTIIETPDNSDCTNVSNPQTHFVTCGYHNYDQNLLSTTGNATGAYAVVPTSADSSCYNAKKEYYNISAETNSYVDRASHEQFESITDPIPGQGWYDSTASTTATGEIGDKCEGQLDFVYLVDTTGTTRTFSIQPEWSNNTPYEGMLGGCDYGQSPPPQATPTPIPPTPTNTPNPAAPLSTADATGYDATNWGKYQQVEMQWTVPAISAGSAANASDLDIFAGFNNDGLEASPLTASSFAVRVGTQAVYDATNPPPTYSAYWEIRRITGETQNKYGVFDITSSQVDSGVIRAVNPGDVVDVTVWYSGNTVYFDFEDKTQNTGTIRTPKNLAAYSGYTWSSYSIHSADCRVSHASSYLAKWTGSLKLQNCEVMMNGTFQPMRNTTYHAENMTTDTDSPLTTISTWDSTGVNFTTSWINGS